MKLFQFLHIHDPVAAGLATLALAVAMGLALGAVRVRGMRLGISGVLFAAVLFGQLGLIVEPAVLKFLRDFALIVFIYALGLQVGPGFFSSLRAEGLRLNLLSVAALALGAVMTAGIVRIAGLPHDAAPGIFTGAFTTTPGLAAGQEVMRQKAQSPAASIRAMDDTALAYSVTYPFGVVGPIFVVVLLRKLFRVRIDAERRELAIAEEARRPSIDSVDFEVTEPAYAGMNLRDHPLVRKHGVILSRMLRDGKVSVPTGDTEVRVGDLFRAVGTRAATNELVAAMGRPAKADLAAAAGDVNRMDMVVTRTQVLRRTLQELDPIRRHGVTIARVIRAGVDLVPKATLRLAFADNIIAVGPAAGLKAVETELGNSPDMLNRPQLLPIFLGIVLGVIVGSIPFTIPGLHTSLRIGLAGGPLLAAIALSQLGNVGSVVWYMPAAANGLFRDFGLAVFLACVGLEAGHDLWRRISSDGGFSYVIWGAALTMLPVFLIACIARVFYKMNFFTLCGWVSGAMTSSPCLSFANEMAGSDAPAVSYAAVAPLATLVPIICAQILAMAGH
jgi:putative transport protein